MNLPNSLSVTRIFLVPLLVVVLLTKFEGRMILGVRKELVAAAIFGVAGLYIGLVAAPTDAQQGDAYRIIFIHVPAAWMSMFLYLVMAFWGAMSLGFNTRLSAMMARAM